MTRRITLSLILAALLATGTAFAAPTVHVQASVDAIAFSSDFAHGTAALRVSGPDGVVERSFDAYEAPSFDAVGADGQYTWELLLVSPISQQQREALDAARAAGDTRAPAKVGVQSQAFSGTFRVLHGAIIVPGAEVEEVAEVAETDPAAALGGSRVPTKAQVFATDLIVQGSGCVGVDCSTTESFGFDTFRLKENNLRLHFNDTSASASFPTNDWRLTANDSSNGGAERFSIEDATNNKTPFTVEGNTPSNTLYVDSAGRVGVQTNSPAVLLHTVDGNSPTLRLEQDGSDGFQSQIWDLAGNETNFFLRDVSNSSLLPFRVQPGAAKNSIYIYSDGDVGMGTPDGGADAPLHVRRTDGTSSLLIEEASGTQASRNLMKLENNGQLNFVLSRTDGTSGSWTFAHNGTSFNITKGGTGANEFSLADSGNLTIRGSLITQNGSGSTYPDYVFEAGYELRSIDELEAFISENGHLPNVTSRTEVDAQGYVNHSELQLQTLEKVEELTLYTIQQQRLIEEQRAMLDELRARLDATP